MMIVAQYLITVHIFMASAFQKPAEGSSANCPNQHQKALTVARL